MNFKGTIDNKRIFTKPNGEQVIDFTEQKYVPGTSYIIDYVQVTDDFVMRPDLIAKLQYRDINMTDVVLKQNGISNPFSIDKNDILFFQEKSAANKQFINTDQAVTADKIRNQYVDTSKATSIDDNLTEFENRKRNSNRTKSTPMLPPNFANFGDQEIKMQGGKVIFGGDVSSKVVDCEDKPISKSELLKRLAKNRMNKGN